MHIEEADLEIQRQPFARPFAFKGSAFHEKWNLVVRLRDGDGNEAVGLGGLAVLWSDPQVFAAHTEVGGNVLLAAMLEHALQWVRGEDFADPPSLLKAILPEVHDYGRQLTGRRDLRPTFTLNALVGLDNAAWILNARRREIDSFDELLPSAQRPLLDQRQRYVALVPAIGYNLPLEEIEQILDQGAYVLKIKIGHPGDEEQMLAADRSQLSRLHELTKARETPMTDCGRVLYYLDANGRYRRKESLLRLLEHADEIGMLERVILVEEPFDEEVQIDVGDVPARLAADESLHSVEDVRTRRQQGYGAIAIKAAGKTFSLALDMLEAAQACGLTSFVADNACVPVLVEWNKNIAARLPAFPGLKGGLMESNGPENYATWPQMLAQHPCAGASWLEPQGGAFVLEEDYFAQSGGIFLEPLSYSRLFRT